MTRKTYFAGIALVCATVVVTGGLLAQDKGYEQEMDPQMQAIQAARMEYMTPREPHQMMAAKAGEYAVTGEMWQMPDAPPMPFEGSSRLESIMDGRYLVEKFEGDFMGMPFEGMGISGFDNLTETYVGAWIDNMSTGILRSEGTPSGDGKIIHYTMDHPDFLKGTYKKTTMVEKTQDADHFTVVFYNTTPEGEEYKHMVLRYARK